MSVMSELIGTFQTHATVRRIGRFAAVGMLGTLIDFSLFTGLNILFGAPILLANTLSYSAGILNNFIWHRRWTFAGRQRRAVGVQFAQFVAVSLTALLINNQIVLLLSSPLGSLLGTAAAGTLLAKACATGVGLIWNFIANTLWTFPASREGGKA